MSSNDNSQNDNTQNDTLSDTPTQNDTVNTTTTQNDTPSNPPSPTNNNTTSTSTSTSTSTNSTSTTTITTTTTSTNNNLTLDLSKNVVITDFILNEVIDNSNNQVINQQGTSADGTFVTHTTMVTDPSNNVVINEDLQGTVVSYYDNKSAQTKLLIDEIKAYATEITCEDFHGKGTIDDYKELFVAASKIATESKQMQLDIDIEGFENFGEAADELASLFTSFITKLQNVSIIDDTNFLRAVANALSKVVNLSNVFGKFKKTILATTQIQLPKSIKDTRDLVEEVMGDVNCAMNYVNYFVNPTDTNLVKAKLSDDDKNVINTAISTINNWNVLCEHGVSISMNNNPDIVYLKNANDNLKTKAVNIQNTTSLLRNKLKNMNLIP